MAGSSLAGGLIGRGKKKRAITSAEAEHSKRMRQYENLDTSNIYAGFQNTMEDLTVNQQQAQFQQQQQRQSQANILSSLRGSAGSSGIAGLAQALSGQANLAAQQSSASIGMQERQNQMASAQGAMQAQQMILGGADQARNLEMSKTATLLGMSQQRLGASKEALAQNDAAMYQGIGAAGGMFAGAMTGGISGGGEIPPVSTTQSVMSGTANNAAANTNMMQESMKNFAGNLNTLEYLRGPQINDMSPKKVNPKTRASQGHIFGAY